MNVVKTIRANDWWEHKIPTILAIAYGTFFLEQQQPADRPGLLLAIFAILVSGAAFVSILNDFTDLESDRLAGKKNRLAAQSPRARKLILWASILPCLITIFCLVPDWLSVLLYLGAVLSYVTYSSEPFRYKNRRFAGIITDSTGSQMFPALLAVSVICYASQDQNWLWFGAVALWSFSYGVRGILWHQLSDKKNDVRSGIRTFATSTSPALQKQASLFVFVLEAISLLAILYLLHNAIVTWTFIGYGITLTIRAIVFKSAVVIAESPAGNSKYHLIFTEFYQLFLPLSILVAMAVIYTPNWIVVAIHVLLFHEKLRIFLRDMYRLVERLVNKNYIHYD